MSIIQREDDRLAFRRLRSPTAPSTATDWVENARSEIDELLEAMSVGHGIEGELGDVLLNLRYAARLLGVSTELAERNSLRKVHARYDYVEAHLTDLGSVAEWEKLWQESKELEK